jgi:hypothetical protein
MSLLFAVCLSALSGPALAPERPSVVVVVGAPGEPEYASRFNEWANLWRAAAEKGGAETVLIGRGLQQDSKDATDHDRLHTVLTERSAQGREPLWLVLIGHGTFDGVEARFNLRGPDFTDSELAGWLSAVKRPVVVIDASAGSAPFLTKLSAPGRVIVTATRSGHELNFARFGGFLAGSIADVKADLDKDGQVSLLEAFLAASARVAESYRTRAELATEHALIDDNGDKRGTPAEFFRGVRASRRAADGTAPDGARAHQLHLVPSDRERALTPAQRQRRDELERTQATLRERKASLSLDAYYAQLEPLMVELAKLYRGLPPAGLVPSR